jgi:DNA-binding protein H-NS
MASLQQLLDQQASIALQIETLKKQGKAQAVAEVKALMELHSLTVADIGTSSRKASDSAPVRKVAAKYRDAATGQTWSGRGLKPKWLSEALAQGKALADFAL